MEICFKTTKKIENNQILYFNNTNQMLNTILAHSLETVNRQSKEIYTNEDNNNLNICFGRAVVNTRYKKHFLSHSGFVSFNIENLQIGFDDKYGFKKEIQRALDDLNDNQLLLQNLSTGVAILSDLELSERQGTGLRKSDICGFPIFLVEADCSLELQYRFWTEAFPKLTGLATPIMIFSGSRSYHILFVPNRMLSVDEHEQLQDIVANIEWWEDKKITEEIVNCKKENEQIKKLKIEEIKAEFKKDFDDLSIEIKEKYLSGKRKFN
ncbi:hypothetical protein AB832_06330 [Flavobacteriaceae bacterium (ex Bugula neritina AB1)]|nr:hypothetical protein AB832_06330 [Flavobacteriaceae bacterium (ex Bugula neritina AB1)]